MDCGSVALAEQLSHHPPVHLLPVGSRVSVRLAGKLHKARALRLAQQRINYLGVVTGPPRTADWEDGVAIALQHH